jgi:CheY-like chemotaxis protein
MNSRSLLTNHMGYELVSACDGKEGLEKALAHKPDLILMDVEMPRMTGIEACRELRRNDTTRNTPIVLLTMRNEGEAVKAGFDSGCSEYLLKPLTEEKLRAVLDKYLR